MVSDQRDCGNGLEWDSVILYIYMDRDQDNC